MTRAPLTAQHACSERAVTRACMASHRIVARSSLHTSLTLQGPTPELSPPHTTSPAVRVLRNSNPPVRAALHTLINLLAPKTPLYLATRAQNSGRAVARSTAQLACARRVMGGDMRARDVLCAFVVRESERRGGRQRGGKRLTFNLWLMARRNRYPSASNGKHSKTRFFTA
jgi:hypothetical protein